MATGAIYIGLSGWRYAPWRGVFYPPDLPQRAELAERIRAWAAGTEPADARRIAPDLRVPRRKRDVYCYFDNDVKVKAPRDAQRLDRLVAGVSRRTTATR